MSEHDQTGAAEQRRPDDIDALFPGRFLKAADLNGREQTITISDVYGEDLEGQKGVKPKAIVTFKRSTPGPREFVLAKINSCALKGMFGSKRTDWIGKRVTLYATDRLMPMPTGEAKGKPCLRILGSPDITAEIPVTFAPPRRKPVYMTMKVTGQRRPAGQPQQPAAPPTTRPASEHADAEPTDDELGGRL